MNKRIIAIVAAAVVCLAVVSAVILQGRVDRSEWPGKQLQNAAALGRALASYHEAHGEYPARLPELVASGMLSGDQLAALQFKVSPGAQPEDWLYRRPENAGEIAIVAPAWIYPWDGHAGLRVVARADGSGEVISKAKEKQLHRWVVAASEAHGDGKPASNPERQNAEILPPEFDRFLDQLIEATSAEERLRIRMAATAEETYDYFGAGMELRNGELRRSDSPLRNALIRKGLFANDDMSAIVLLSCARRIRGEPVRLEEQISRYRDFWASSDLVAPTELACPVCQQEMKVAQSGSPPGSGWQTKGYFQGVCPAGHVFWYYHKDGWQSTEALDTAVGNHAARSNGGELKD